MLLFKRPISGQVTVLVTIFPLTMTSCLLELFTALHCLLLRGTSRRATSLAGMQPATHLITNRLTGTTPCIAVSMVVLACRRRATGQASQHTFADVITLARTKT